MSGCGDCVNIVINNNNNNNDKTFEIELLCKNIQNPERSVRQKALKAAQQLCENLSEYKNILTIEDLFDLMYLHIIKCYSDKFESCREIAIDIISKLLKELPVNDYYLGIIIPVITQRIGLQQPSESFGNTNAIISIEESEEICLSLLNQLREIIEKFEYNENDYLITFYNDIIDILLNTIKNSEPIVQRETCSVIKLLSNSTKCFFVRVKSLIESLLIMVHHRQSQNRIAAIETIGTSCLFLQQSSENDEYFIKIFTTLSPLLMDPIPHVRLACGKISCLWMLKLSNRYSFIERIIPMILCCLQDEIVDIRTEILESWKQCGIQYYHENEQELNKIELIDEKPKSYPNDIQRPTIGCRAICQRGLRICTIVLKEMQNWKEDVRLHSVKLLRQIVLHCEASLNVKFHKIYPILSQTCMDHDRMVVIEAENVSKLCGIVLNYNGWIEHGLNSLKNDNLTLGTLKCFTIIYKASDVTEKASDIVTIVKLLLNPMICENLKLNYQIELLNVIEILVELYLIKLTNLNDQMKAMKINIDINEEQLLYEILIKIIALSDGNDDIFNKGKSILNRLAQAPWNLRDLHGKYLDTIIKSIDDLDSENSDNAKSIVLLNGIVSICGYQLEYLDTLKTALNVCLKNAKPEGKIKILSAVSMSMLSWTTSLNTNIEKSTIELKLFIEEIIEPLLIWRAGRSSEAVRTMATATLCSCSQGAKQESYEIFPNFIIHFIALIEDSNVSTRAFALRCLLNCGPFSNVDKLKQLALGVLARLDDVSFEIREYAAQCIYQLKFTTINSDADMNTWNEYIKYILQKLILYLDDPDIKLRKSILNAIYEIGKVYRNVFHTVYDNVPTDFPHMKDLNEIKHEIFD